MRPRAAAAIAVTMVCAWGATGPGLTAQGAFAISVLSSRPDMISGDDALIEIKVPATEGLTVKLNDQDVTRVFAPNAARQSVIGLVEGLKLGANRVEARRGPRSARLDLTNYPITGPIVSGEHLKPFVCNTAQSGLGEPLDEDCSAPTKVEYFYRSSTPPPATGSGAAPAFAPSAFKRLENPTAPILHFRSYNDGAGDIHDRFRDFSVRERLRKANGRFDNQVIWIYPGAVAGLGQKVSGLAIDTMSQWLDALAKTPVTGSAADRIKRTKPAAATDGCWDLEGTRLDEVATFAGTGRCNTLFPNHKNPRLVAGAPLADDVTTCALKPIDTRDYKATFTAEQMQTLKAIFPHGVCDYSKPGLNQAPLAGTYLKLPLSSRVPSNTTSRAQQ